jgi:hypothetical protein
MTLKKCKPAPSFGASHRYGSLLGGNEKNDLHHLDSRRTKHFDTDTSFLFENDPDLQNSQTLKVSQG